MSSARKDIVQIVGVHKVPSHLSKEEFEAKYETLVEEMVALPSMKNNFLKLEIFLQNDRFDQYLESYRCPPRESLVIVRGEIESAESYIAVLSDPEVQKKMEGAKNFSLQAQTSAFFTDVDQNFERESRVAPKDRVHIFGIYRIPDHISKDKFENGFIKFFEDYSEIPTIRKNFVKMEKWMPNNAVDDHIHRVGYPPPETMFISHSELETWENVIDFQNEDSFKAVLAAKSDFDLNTNASVFTADLITKFERS